MINSNIFKWPYIGDEDIEKVVDLLKSGKISINEELVYGFEQQICKYFNVNHALLTTNGTSAAFSCFHAIDLKPGDEIIGPAYTHWATLLPAVPLGCRVVFADIEQHSLSISVEDIMRKISPTTKAIVVCHMFGNPVDIESISRICEEKGIFLIEDISHAPGAKILNKPVGSFGYMAFFSMQANKMISGGEGGAVLTNSLELYERAVMLGQPKRNFRLSEKWEKYGEVSLGYKFRISPIHALLAQCSFNRLEEQIEIRSKMFKLFRENISDIDALSFPLENSGAKRVYLEYEIFLNSKKLAPRSIAKSLVNNGLIAGGSKFDHLPELSQFKQNMDTKEIFGNSIANNARLLLLSPFKSIDYEVLEEYIKIFKTTINSALNQ